MQPESEWLVPSEMRPMSERILRIITEAEAYGQPVLRHIAQPDSNGQSSSKVPITTARLESGMNRHSYTVRA